MNVHSAVKRRLFKIIVEIDLKRIGLRIPFFNVLLLLLLLGFHDKSTNINRYQC